MLEHNALNPNALNPNALNPRALDPGGLQPIELALNVLSEAQLPESTLYALRAPGKLGALSRQLLKYLVGCALDTTQAFSFVWRDVAGEVRFERYPGALALATSWVREPLSEAQQQWVSACVAARTNRHGIPVLISLRGPHPALQELGPREGEAYPLEEGAFWGNLFADPPRLHACYSAPNIDSSRAHRRDCAAGALDPLAGGDPCGIIHVVGSCQERCDDPSEPDTYHPRCDNKAGEISIRPITVYLP